MNITIQQSVLAAALSRASDVAEKKTTTPLLTCALIKATADGITVTATDKALTYTGAYAAEVRTPGEVAVPAATLLSTVKMLPKGPVTLALQANGKIKVTAGSATYNVNAFGAADFPPAPEVKDTKVLSIDAAELRRILDQTIKAVAAEDNRYGLNGIKVEPLSDNVVRFVATDGNRLNYADAAYSGELGIGRKMLLPRPAAVQIRALIDGYEGGVELAFGERAAVFTIPGVSLTIRLLEADFPDYRQVLPTTYKRRAFVDRASLAAALNRVAIFATDGAHTVSFAFTGDALNLSARKLDAGDAGDEVAIDFTGENMTTGFNVRFVLDALATMAGQRVVVEMGDSLAPCIMRDPDEDRARCIVMPVRLA